MDTDLTRAHAWRAEQAKRIKAARHAKGFTTVKQWAAASQFDASRLRSWDSGQRTPQNWDLVAVAAELDASPSYLAGFDAEPEAPAAQGSSATPTAPGTHSTLVNTRAFAPALELWDVAHWRPVYAVTDGYYVAELAGEHSIWLATAVPNERGQYLPQWSDAAEGGNRYTPERWAELGYTVLGRVVSYTRQL